MGRTRHPARSRAPRPSRQPPTAWAATEKSPDAEKSATLDLAVAALFDTAAAGAANQLLRFADTHRQEPLAVERERVNLVGAMQERAGRGDWIIVLALVQAVSAV